MTPQEQEMIDGLVDRIRKTQVTDKDTAAEQRLQQGLAGYADATYVLAQTVLVQQYGLGQAQSQIGELKQQVETLQSQMQQAAEHAKSSGGGSFLSHIFGTGSSSQPSAPPPQASPYQPVNNPGYSAQPYPGGSYPPPAYAPQGYPQQSSGMFGGGGGGFLQGALQTAAGVAAGEIAFQGMESLFHGFERGGGGYGSGFMGGGGGGETVVNNYYDEDRGGREDRGRDDGGRGDSSFYNPSDDASRSESGAQFADTGDSGGSADLTSSDDSSFGDSSDTSGFDDNSSSDDGGSF